MARLNPEAPEFFPNQHHNQQLSISWRGVPTSMSIPPHQHCYFVLSSFYSSQVIHQVHLQPHPPCLSVTVPSLSFPFHDGTYMCKQLSTPLLPLPTSGAEPTRSCYLTEIEPDTLMEAEVEKQQEATKEAGSKGHAQNRVMNAIMGCGRMNGRRGVWRKKKERHVGEDQKYGYFKNRQFFGREDKYFSFRAFSHKKRYRPTIPVRVDGEETTVMIKNIPNKYTRDMLVDFLDKQCVLLNRRDEDGSELENEDDQCVLAFDFVYLPIDFESGMNKGYAFVNFTSPEGAWRFNLTVSNTKWELFQSHKIRVVVAARLQGIDNLRSHFETMNFPCESEEVLPLCFSPPRDGVIKGEETTMGSLFKRQQVAE